MGLAAFRQALLGVLVAVVLSTVCWAQGSTLEEVRDGYRASIKLLNPAWTRSLYSSGHDGPNPSQLSQPAKDRPIEWAIDGSKFMYQSGLVDPPDWFSYDGRVVWDLFYGNPSVPDPTDPKRMCVTKQALRTRTDNELRESTSPGIWLGLYVRVSGKAQSGESFGSMLAKPDAELLGTEVVDGVPCVKVRLVFEGQTVEKPLGFPIIVWFDPQHGFLPRQFRYDLSARGVVNDFQVLEFISETTPGGKTLHFPRRMQQRSKATWKEGIPDSYANLVVEEWTLGRRNPAVKFQPAIPEGVQVFELVEGDQNLGFQNFIRQAQDLPPIPTQVAIPAPPPAQALAVPVIEAVPPGSWLPTLLLLAGVAISLCGTYFLAVKK